MRRVLEVFAAILLSVLLAGCSSTPASGPSRDGIVQLNLITVPVALDLDGKSGPDGVSVKLFANEAKDPKAVRIRDGVVEMILFDGTFSASAHEAPPILRTFRFEAAELRAAEFKSRIGTGYQLLLPWGTSMPTRRIISVAARFTRASGQIVRSQASSVTVLAK